MKKTVPVLLTLFLTAAYSCAQAADVASSAKASAISAAKVNVEEKVDYEALYSKVPEIREINKQIYEAKKAGKPYQDLMLKKKEAIKRYNESKKK
ncbi:MAG: hypothetical protein IJ532_00410 [Alphaproteobacteria bacterium]|nr:hypothetical protein [Alphaproteobacteria bacterium]